MGLVVLGIFAFTTQGFHGSIYQMLNHGLSTGALFLLVGMIYDRRHTRMIADFGGLAHSHPVLASVFMVVTLSSIGLPGLNGFVGEVLVLVGTFARNRAFAAVAALGMILGAVYMLWMYQRVFLGKVTDPANTAMTDLGPREKIILIPIMLMMLWMGVYSAPFLRRMDASIARLQERVEDARGSGGTYRVQRLNGNLNAGERAR